MQIDKAINFPQQPNREGDWTISVAFLKSIATIVEQGEFPEYAQDLEGIHETLAALTKTEWWNNLISKYTETLAQVERLDKQLAEECKINERFVDRIGSLESEVTFWKGKTAEVVEALKRANRLATTGNHILIKGVVRDTLQLIGGDDDDA